MKENKIRAFAFILSGVNSKTWVTDYVNYVQIVANYICEQKDLPPVKIEITDSEEKRIAAGGFRVETPDRIYLHHDYFHDSARSALSDNKYKSYDIILTIAHEIKHYEQYLNLQNHKDTLITEISKEIMHPLNEPYVYNLMEIEQDANKFAIDISKKIYNELKESMIAVPFWMDRFKEQINKFEQHEMQDIENAKMQLIKLGYVQQNGNDINKESFIAFKDKIRAFHKSFPCFKRLEHYDTRVDHYVMRLDNARRLYMFRGENEQRLYALVNHNKNLALPILMQNNHIAIGQMHCVKKNGINYGYRLSDLSEEYNVISMHLRQILKKDGIGDVETAIICPYNLTIPNFSAQMMSEILSELDQENGLLYLQEHKINIFDELHYALRQEVPENDKYFESDIAKHIPFVALNENLETGEDFTI